MMLVRLLDGHVTTHDEVGKALEVCRLVAHVLLDDVGRLDVLKGNL